MNQKVLIVGFGSSGQRYFKIIKDRYPQTDIKVYSYTKKNKKFFINNKSDLILYDPETIFFCNPSSKRIHFLDLINNSQNIFFEKPLSHNLKDGNKIYLSIKKKNLTAVGYNLRFYNILNFVKKNMKKYIGNVYSFNCENGYLLKKWRIKNYTKTVTASKKLGGGALLEMSHELDYLTWIFGKKYKCKAYGFNTKQLKIDVEDNVKIIFNFSNKFLGSLSLDLLSNQKKRFLIINGTKGVLKIDLIKNTIRFLAKNSKLWKNIFFKKNKIEDTYFEVVDYFLKKKIDRNKSNIASVKDGVFVLQVLKSLKNFNNNVFK